MPHKYCVTWSDIAQEIVSEETTHFLQWSELRGISMISWWSQRPCSAQCLRPAYDICHRILCSQRNVLSQGQNLRIISDMEVQWMVKRNFTFNHTMVTVFWPIGTFLCKHKIWWPFYKRFNYNCTAVSQSTKYSDLGFTRTDKTKTQNKKWK